VTINKFTIKLSVKQKIKAEHWNEVGPPTMQVITKEVEKVRAEHSHNTVDDAKGNAEALLTMKRDYCLKSSCDFTEVD
jgi:hypothetical protein